MKKNLATWLIEWTRDRMHRNRSMHEIRRDIERMKLLQEEHSLGVKGESIELISQLEVEALINTLKRGVGSDARMLVERIRELRKELQEILDKKDLDPEERKDTIRIYRAKIRAVTRGEL